jgi:hypothetical protein
LVEKVHLFALRQTLPVSRGSPSPIVGDFMRRKRLKLIFRRSFSVKGIDRLLSPGDYELCPTAN